MLDAWWFMPFGKEMSGWRRGSLNGHACCHISKLFFIPSLIHLILLLFPITSRWYWKRERAWHEWWLKWIGWQSISKRATERKVIDVFTQHKMDVAHSVTRRFRKALFEPPEGTAAAKSSHTSKSIRGSPKKYSTDESKATLPRWLRWPWMRSAIFANYFALKSFLTCDARKMHLKCNLHRGTRPSSVSRKF